VVAVKSEPQPSPPLPTFAQVITSDAENRLKMFSPKLTGLHLFQNGYKCINIFHYDCVIAAMTKNR